METKGGTVMGRTNFCELSESDKKKVKKAVERIGARIDEQSGRILKNRSDFTPDRIIAIIRQESMIGLVKC